MSKSNYEAKDGSSVDFDEFLEYYTYVSALYESDAAFDKMITNTWRIYTNINPAAIPYAGIPK